MIILHFHLQPQFKNELFRILHIIINVIINIIVVILVSCRHHHHHYHDYFPSVGFFFSPFSIFTSSKRFSRQLHQVERKLREIRNMALTVDCFCCFDYLFLHFLLIHPLKHLLFQLDYRAAANEVEALKEENDLLRRKYVHSNDCPMFPLEIFSLISCGSQ